MTQTRSQYIFCFLLAGLFFSCKPGNPGESGSAPALPLVGSWELISGTTIQGKDTVVTDYTKGKRFIKIINATHFAFAGHDLAKGKDSSAFFSSGAGTYTLNGNQYTEHLQFCSDRAWEGNDFSFTITIEKDTLTQTGIEKIEKIGVDRLNIERYARTTH